MPPENNKTEEERPLPPDFAHRLATKVVVTHERERNPETATLKLAEVLVRNLNQPARATQFMEMTRILLEEKETRRYAALSWAAPVIEKEHLPAVEKFLALMLDQLIDEHMNLTKPLYEMEMRRKKFSHYAWLMGEVFISMMEISSDLYEVLSKIFGDIIRKEMALETQNQEDKSVKRRIIIGSSKEKEMAAKKLFDDILDYIHTRGEFKSDSLNQKNPNEFISILADRLRGTRRYIIQDILNRQALERKKQAEKEISERQASAEEIIRARDPFKKSVMLFWTEKRYNFKYLSVEKVRITLQVLAIVIGIMIFLMGYLGMAGMHWGEGIFVAFGMYLFARFAASKQSFKKFYPNDVSKELETVVGMITPVFRKMSKDQLQAFLTRQVKDPDNQKLLPLVPEFIKYLFAVMPDRRNMILQMDELSAVMEDIELEVARQIRDSGHHHAA